MSPVAFIIGFGKGVGSAVAAKFKSQGFSVAVASRSLVPDEIKKNYGYLGINLDMAKPSEVEDAFNTVESLLGPANVVVYNGVCIIVAKSRAQQSNVRHICLQ